MRKKIKIKNQKLINHTFTVADENPRIHSRTPRTVAVHHENPIGFLIKIRRLRT